MQISNLLEAIPYGVYIKDREKKYVNFNLQFLTSLNIQNINFIKDKLDHDLPWSCFADSYQSDDDYIFETKQNLTIVNPVRLANNKTVFLVNKRSPMISKPNGAVEAIFSMSSPIEQHQFCSAMFLLHQRDQFYVGDKLKKTGYIISECQGPENLSPKEFECLFFMLRGKNAREIAEITFRSIRTIEAHIDNLKHKFSCSSKSALIEKALDAGLLRIIPKSVFEKISY